MTRPSHINSLVFFLFLLIPYFAFADSGNGRFTITRGTISAIDASSVTVNGITFTLNGSTEFEDLNDQNTNVSAFAVGDFVKVRADPSTLVVDELDLEDDADDNKNGGGSTNDDGVKQQSVTTTCEFPSGAFLQKGIAQSIKDALIANGATSSVRVDVSLRFSRAARVKIPTAQAAPGLVVTANAAGASDLVTLSGEISPQACEGTVNVRARIRGGGLTTDTVTQTLTVNGILVAHDRGSR
jgi:hypothetical protein